MQSCRLKVLSALRALPPHVSPQTFREQGPEAAEAALLDPDVAAVVGSVSRARSQALRADTSISNDASISRNDVLPEDMRLPSRPSLTTRDAVNGRGVFTRADGAGGTLAGENDAATSTTWNDMLRGPPPPPKRVTAPPSVDWAAAAIDAALGGGLRSPERGAGSQSGLDSHSSSRRQAEPQTDADTFLDELRELSR